MKPGPPTDSLRRVRVLVNPKSGLGFSFDSFWGIVEEQFGPFGADVSYQFSRDVADGRRKAEGAVRDGVDALIVVGGDGMVNSIGSALGRLAALSAKQRPEPAYSKSRSQDFRRRVACAPNPMDAAQKATKLSSAR